QALDRLVEQVEHLVAVDLHLGRQRRGPGGGDDVVDLAQDRLDVAPRHALRHPGVEVVLEGVVVVVHRCPPPPSPPLRYFSTSSFATAGGTIELMSPP